MKNSKFPQRGEKSRMREGEFRELLKNIPIYLPGHVILYCTFFGVFRIMIFFHPLDKHQAGHVLYAEMTK